MNDKLCPYCFKSIKGNYGSTNEDIHCPHPDCGKKIPKLYLQHIEKHIASIVNGKNERDDFGYEVGCFAKEDNAETKSCRAEYLESDDDKVQFVLYEYPKDDYSEGTETTVLVFHRCEWNETETGGIPEREIKFASAILLNIDVTQLKALYFNVGISRTKAEFDQWQPRKINGFIRAVAKYLKSNHLIRKTAITFKNLQGIREYAFFQNTAKYDSLLDSMQEWSGGPDDRRQIIEKDKIIRDLLIELGEERMIMEGNEFSGQMFFFYPSSEYRMTSNNFWMMAVMMWICTTIEKS